jgi:hypothetical protein
MNTGRAEEALASEATEQVSVFFGSGFIAARCFGMTEKIDYFSSNFAPGGVGTSKTLSVTETNE